MIALAIGAVIWRRNNLDNSERSGLPPWKTAIFFGLGAAFPLLLQMAVWNLLYGSWFSGPEPYFSRESTGLEWWPMHILDVLFSERGGVLAWHSILLIGLIGLILGRRTFEPGFTAIALIGLGLQIYLIGSWSVWWGGASFGNRLFISSYPWLALGLAEALRRIQKQCFAN